MSDINAEDLKLEEHKIMPEFHPFDENKKTVKEQILEFDLNEVFHLSYSFDILKKVIEKIVMEVDNQDKHQSSLENELKRLQKEMNENKDFTHKKFRDIDVKIGGIEDRFPVIDY